MSPTTTIYTETSFCESCKWLRPERTSYTCARYGDVYLTRRASGVPERLLTCVINDGFSPAEPASTGRPNMQITNRTNSRILLPGPIGLVLYPGEAKTLKAERLDELQKYPQFLNLVMDGQVSVGPAPVSPTEPRSAAPPFVPEEGFRQLMPGVWEKRTSSAVPPRSVAAQTAVTEPSTSTVAPCAIDLEDP